MFRMGQEEIDAAAKVIQSGSLFRINKGLQEVDRFERELAEKIGTEHALCVTGGTAALTCALVGMGIGPGDEVIVPAYTFMTTALAVTSVGAVPVLAEIDETMTIDARDVENKLSPNVKAVIPVDMVGFPSNMEALCALGKKHGIQILEDVCQADGGSYHGRRLGTWGSAAAFSFNHFKIISAGEGGAVVTNDRRIYERALIYHDGGSSFRPYAGDLQEPVFMGTQYRVSEITGAILRVQLGRLDGILADLRRVKKSLTEKLAGLPGLRFSPLHDADGECATTLAFTFENESRARAFAAGEGVNGWLPIDSGKHVYSNWDPLLSGRGAHCAAFNPFEMPQNKELRIRYTKEMCPKTLDILSRTVYISLHCDWEEDRVSKLAESCMKAVRAL